VSEFLIFWSWVEPFRGEVVAFILTLLGIWIGRLLRPKVKLIWGRSNNSLHFVPTEVPAEEKKDTEITDVQIYAEKYFLQNNGKKPATNVEFVLSHTPNNLSIWQSRQYKKSLNPEGNLVVSIPSIAPLELIIIDTVYINRQAATVESVECSEVLGKEVSFFTQRKFGKFTLSLVAISMALGAYYSLFLVYSIISYLVGLS